MSRHSTARLPAPRSDLFGFEVSGRIHRDDIEQMSQTLQSAFTRHGKVDILIVMRNWDASAHVRRYAAVGAPAWAMARINLFSPLTAAEERR